MTFYPFCSIHKYELISNAKKIYRAVIYLHLTIGSQWYLLYQRHQYIPSSQYSVLLHIYIDGARCSCDMLHLMLNRVWSNKSVKHPCLLESNILEAGPSLTNLCGHQYMATETQPLKADWWGGGTLNNFTVTVQSGGLRPSLLDQYCCSTAGQIQSMFSHNGILVTVPQAGIMYMCPACLCNSCYWAKTRWRMADKTWYHGSLTWW